MRKRPGIEALRATLAVAIIVLGWSEHAHAQPASGPPTEAADEDVKRGGELYEAGKNAEAASVWEKALERIGEDAGWKLHYNLGLAYEGAGDVTPACRHYDAFLTRVAAEAAALPAELEERREDAAARVRALKASHAALVLPPQERAVMVRIDGGPPRRVGFTAYVVPGAHTIDIVGPTGVTRHQPIEVVAGGTLRIDTRDPTPVPKPRPPPPPPPPEPREEPEFPTIVVAVGAALTAASFALPIGFWFAAADKRNEATDLGQGHTAYAAARDEFESARTRYQASYALPAGLGAVTLGIAIWGVVHVSQGSQAAMLSLDGRF